MSVFNKNEGNTALHLAIARNHFVLADYLIKHGSNEKIENKLGESPWHCLSNKNNR